MFKHPKTIYRNKVIFATALIFALCFSGALPAVAGGLIAYEIGSQDVGLASAGYNVRAQDAATVYQPGRNDKAGWHPDSGSGPT